MVSGFKIARRAHGAVFIINREAADDDCHIFDYGLNSGFIVFPSPGKLVYCDNYNNIVTVISLLCCFRFVLQIQEFILNFFFLLYLFFHLF